jgi:hypothetical protein
MANKNGKVFGLTLLCPILNDEQATPSHDLQIRYYLASLPTGAASPFAIAPNTHLARLVVMDDVIYVGHPSTEEHLKSKYLVFETNTDVDLEAYVTGLAENVPEHVEAIWSHCAGYPGVTDVAAFVKYMKACQIPTTFFFAAVNDKSVTETLTALETKRAVSEFIVTHQGMDPAQVQREFAAFVRELRSAPPPAPGVARFAREIKTGGHNE